MNVSVNSVSDLVSFISNYLDIAEDNLVLEAQHGNYRMYSTTTEDQYMIRVFPTDNQQEVFKRFQSEAQIINHVQKYTTLPVPSIHDVIIDPKNPYAILLMERMDGIVLEEAWPYLDNQQRRSLTQELAIHLNILHQIRIDGFGFLPNTVESWSELLINRIKTGLDRLTQYSLSKSLLARVRVALAQWQSSLPEGNPVVVHGDINSYNLLVTSVEEEPQISGIVDWEWGMGGLPGYDLTGIDSLFYNQYDLVSTFFQHYQPSFQHPDWDYERKLYLLDKFVLNANYYLDTNRYTSQRQRLTSFMIRSLLS